jgi:hypothetical protein
MLSTILTTPTFSTLAQALGLYPAEELANWRRRAEARRLERRLEAELAAMTPRERQEIDITRGNAAWAELARTNA